MAINTTDLTTQALDGSGVFDVLMNSVRLHLQREYDENRIRGNDYAQVYTEAINAAMQASIGYAVQKGLADEQTLNAIEERNNAIEERNNTIEERNNTIEERNVITANKNLLDQKLITEKAQTDDAAIDIGSQVGAQVALLQAQIAKVNSEEELLDQKKTTESAQTNAANIGTNSILDKQRTLYTNQATGYEVDQLVKAGKLHADILAVQLNINEGVDVLNTGFDKADTKAILDTLKTQVTT